MTVNSRPRYGESVGVVKDAKGNVIGRVIFADHVEKFIDDLLQEVANNVAVVTAITNQQQLIEGGSSEADEIEPPMLQVQTVMQTTVVINHLHMDCDGEDQPEPMFVPGP